ncbi:hypothetical protein FH972_021969 [Carpinus fangiana]|uniref:ERT1/acuK family PAS domain-containing protein n=1 Tax=Carpinus fangiana TaxID=176857 RepID=A0A5N6KRE7_9ROSI|nr:hypothetical protein FH972_021969 [Carpinus fangiana]
MVRFALVAVVALLTLVSFSMCLLSPFGKLLPRRSSSSPRRVTFTRDCADRYTSWFQHMTCDQARPCSRCIKRNIGHLCHDEPREQKKGKSEPSSNGNKVADGVPGNTPVDGPFSAPDTAHIDPSLNLNPAQLPQPTSANPSQLSRSAATTQAPDMPTDSQPFVPFNDCNASGQTQSSEMQNLHQNYMFNTSEVGNEYSLLNDFLSTSLIDDAFYQGDGEGQAGLFADSSLGNIIGPMATPGNLFATTPSMAQGGTTPQPLPDSSTSKAEAAAPREKEKENYFMTAADPAGTDTPEERMTKLFTAKYDAGLLTPWNYVKGYAKLYKWMELNLSRASRTRITRQMERFRPEFRKRTQDLTDVKLVFAEIWFERKLMEYDRVFASMAIPACCWRRTGDIFRGNREMAELLQVPLEELRDGKLGIHNVLVESSLTNYWEKFTSIAFDMSQKAILTGCVLKSQNGGPEQRCCFSFTVQRDPHDVYRGMASGSLMSGGRVGNTHAGQSTIFFFSSVNGTGLGHDFCALRDLKDLARLSPWHPSLLDTRPKVKIAPKDFAASIPARLSSRSEDTTLPLDLERHASTLRHDPNAFRDHSVDDLDRHGTTIWNSCVRLKRDNPNIDKHLHCLLRIFAFMLLDHRQRPIKCTPDENFRLLRISNKVSRSLLEENQFLGPSDLGAWVFERAADYDSALYKQRDNMDDDEVQSYNKLKLEHRLQRIMLSMFGELTPVDFQNDPCGTESAADLCFEIGKDLLHRKDDYKAVKWLESSYDALTSHDLVELSEDAAELRLSVLHFLIRALLKLTDNMGLEKAKELVCLLEQDCGSRMVVPLLHMEIIAAETDFDSAAYCAQLHRISRIAVMNSSNFKTIMSHVLILRDHDAAQACRFLDEFVGQRLLPEDKPEWLERAMITRLWISTDRLLEQPDLERDIRQLFDLFHTASHNPLTTAATNAAQVLLWKQVDSLTGKQRYTQALIWCNLGLHPIFSHAGELNVSKLRRKAMLCSISLSDTATVRAQFNLMPESSRQNPLTQYLMYKTAVLDHDLPLASECLESLAKNTSQDVTVLYACVLEAQNSGYRDLALSALQKVLEQFDYSVPCGVHLPALVRCTAKLLLSGIADGPKAGGRDTARELSELFKGALKSAQKQTAASEILEVKELEWFVRTTYNTSILYYTEWSFEIVIDLLDTCIGFILLLQSRSNPEVSEESEESKDATKRSQICHVLAAQLWLKAARATPSLPDQLHNYAQLRTHTTTYWRTDPPSPPTPTQEPPTLHRKMLLLDFEAAAALQLWDALASLLARATSLALPRPTLDACADILLASPAPPAVRARLLAAILDAPPRVAPAAKLARWLRLLYQLAAGAASTQPGIAASGGGDETASRQAVVRRVCAAADAAAYPVEELEWLVATTFNAAVDAYCAGDRGGCLRMGELALEVAERVRDGGRMRDGVRERLGRMVWDG